MSSDIPRVGRILRWFMWPRFMWCRFVCGMSVVLVLFAPFEISEVHAQAPGTQSAKAAPNEAPASPAEIELVKRIEAARTARNSGDPAAVALANHRLIAFALREMGQLRLLEAAYPQAMELYRRSLDFEELPDTRVDLAIAELQAGRLDDAIADTEKALATSSDVRAYVVNGRAWSRKREYGKAADALSHAVQIKPDIETLYALGICLLDSKDEASKQRAADVFEQMIQLAGDSGSLHVLFGRAYRDAEYMPDSIRELKRAVELDPRTQHAHYFLGLAILSANEWKPLPEATAEFRQELEYYPRDFLANYMLGFTDSIEREYDESNKYLNIAASVNPTWPEPFLYLGLNAFAQGDMKSAEEAFRKTIELTGKDESRSSYQIRRAYVDLARILEKSGRTDEADAFVAKAHDLQKKVMEQTQQSVASMALAGGAGSAAALVPINTQQEEEAAPILDANVDPFGHVDASTLAHANLNEKQRASADSQETRLRTILGVSFNDLATSEAVSGAYRAALGHYQEAEHWNPTIAGLQKNLGLCAYRANNYPEAIRGLSRALVDNSSDAPVRAMLGMAYFGTGAFADAVKTFEPLGARGMQDSLVGYAWAASLTRVGDLKKATEVLSQYEKGRLSNDALIVVGQLWTEIGNYARAVNSFHQALETDPSLPKAHLYAGEAAVRWEHWPEAAEEFKAELALAPGDADAKYNLGFVYAQQSKTDEAMELFQQVIAANPDYANAQYQVGKILLDRGKLDDAIAHLEAAARLSPNIDYMHYQLQAAYRKDARIADADRELAIYKDLKAKSRDRAAQSVQTP
jgi:tetratricopeptide (TPR) repeat protein